VGVAQYLGILLITVGALLLSLRRVRKLRWSRGVPWMLLAVVLISVGGITSKYLLGIAPPWTIFAYGKLGTFVAVLPFLASGYHAFGQAYRRYGAPVLTFTLLSEGLTAISTIFFLYAASTQYITLVNALVAIHPFFLLLFTVLLSLYRPSILKEKHDGALILRKFAAIACMFVGTLLVM
jgi:drug/metabolite transporter (DMT)-like permease